MWISEILYLKCQISNHSSTNTEITCSSICQDFCTSISGSRDFFDIGSTVLLCSALLILFVFSALFTDAF